MTSMSSRSRSRTDDGDDGGCSQPEHPDRQDDCSSSAPKEKFNNGSVIASLNSERNPATSSVHRRAAVKRDLSSDESMIKHQTAAADFVLDQGSEPSATAVLAAGESSISTSTAAIQQRTSSTLSSTELVHLAGALENEKLQAMSGGSNAHMMKKKTSYLSAAASVGAYTSSSSAASVGSIPKPLWDIAEGGVLGRHVSRATADQAAIPPKLRRPQTVVWVGGSSNDSDRADTEQASAIDSVESTEPSSRIVSHVPVAAELMDHGDEEMADRVRRRLLDEAATAHVVGELKSERRCLWIGGIVFALLLGGIGVVVALMVSRDNDNSRGTGTSPESAPVAMFPSVTPSPSSQLVSLHPSNQPTVALSEREQNILDAVGPVLDTDILIGKENDSHQASALEWLLYNDTFAHTNPHETVERFILVLFYFTTDGSNWVSRGDFLDTSRHHCDWRVAGNGVICTESLDVEVLRFPDNKLRGSIPTEIRYLSSLDVLDLDENELTGTVPTELGMIRPLTILRLAANVLTGTIPSNLFELTDLYEIHLNENDLTGYIPSNIGNCIRLRSLRLDQNKLVGEVPISINDLSRLEELGAWRNLGLNGTIPSFESARSLMTLNLGANAFTGTIPPALFNHTQLGFLALHDNHLTGTIPPEATSMPELSHFWLFYNALSGSLPCFDGTPKLGDFDIEYNEFTGTLDCILNVSTPELFAVRANHNRFSGSIPEGIENLSIIRALILSENELTGTVPTALGLLTTSYVLSLFDNRLTGSLPTEIGQLGQLKSLAMGRNMLTGTLPDEWSALTSLEGLFLASNSLTGTVPESWNTTNFDSISEILLNANNLTGTLDRGFCDDATNYTRFVSDCLGEDAPVECSCCTVCCDHSEPGICNQTRASSK